MIVCLALCVLDADSKATSVAGKGGRETKNNTKKSTKLDDIDGSDDTIPSMNGSSDGNQTKNRTDESTKPDDTDAVTDWDDLKIPDVDGSSDSSDEESDVDEFSHLNDNTTKTEDADEGHDWHGTATTPDTDNSTFSSDLWGKTNTTSNATQSEIRRDNDSKNSTTSQNTTQQATKASIGYWIPIFNFGNDFYFGTNKGYAKLVNFPAPVIYSFLPVGAKENSPFYGGPTVGQPRQENVYGGGTEQNLPFYGTPTMDEPGLEYEYGDSTGDYFDSEPNFSDCYVNMELGNMIPYSYFGNWVPVYNLENVWYLQTYQGYVPLDMSGFQAPVTYEFDPIVYQYSNVPSAVEQESQYSADPGLALWNSPVVMEN